MTGRKGLVLWVGVCCAVTAEPVDWVRRGSLVPVLRENHVLPLSDQGNRGGWVRDERFWDEFEGDRLDPDKWWPRNPAWKGRPPLFFHPRDVAVADGELLLTTRGAGDVELPDAYTHTCGYVKSRDRMHYGYVEIEAKPLGAPLVSGFWLYDSTPVEWTEIDIAELSAGVHEWRRSYNMNAHVFHSPGYRGTPEHHLAWPARWTAASDLAHDYHVLGLEWNADHVTWYVDGVVVRRLGNEHWHQPLFLNINLEANAWFGAVPSQATVHGAYRIRYVRAWTRAHR